jgi:hypothetical protein
MDNSDYGQALVENWYHDFSHSRDNINEWWDRTLFMMTVHRMRPRGQMHLLFDPNGFEEMLAEHINRFGTDFDLPLPDDLSNLYWVDGEGVRHWKDPATGQPFLDPATGQPFVNPPTAYFHNDFFALLLNDWFMGERIKWNEDLMVIEWKEAAMQELCDYFLEASYRMP